MLINILYSCFLLVIIVCLFFLWRDIVTEILCLKLTKLLGIRKWEYYEDYFGSGDEKTNIHLRICQYTNMVQVYDYDKKKFVNYNE
jgi:hypothetical protein